MTAASIKLLFFYFSAVVESTVFSLIQSEVPISISCPCAQD